MIYISRQVHCKLQRVRYIVWKRHELWSTNGLKLDRSFYPPSVNSAFHFIPRLCWWRSANGIQPHFVKQCMVDRANNLPWRSLRHPSRKKWGPKNFYICSFFRRLRDLMANIWWTKRDIDNQARVWKVRRVSLRCRKILRTFIHKRLKTRLEFLPTVNILFYPSPSQTLYEALTWRPTATRWNGIGFVCDSDSKPQKMLSWKRYHVGWP